MSKEIKFRAWDGTQMYTPIIGTEGEIFRDYRDVEDFNPAPHDNLMQYTGLKDKNGKDIYEGDILRFPAETLLDEKSFIGYEVFYHDNDCADRHVGFQMNRMHFYGSLCGGECKGYMLPKYTSRMVIIGNIYESPELIHGT